jgi:aryl-phospho-beta-D-glucosidase BglC (GH1 family)
VCNGLALTWPALSSVNKKKYPKQMKNTNIVNITDGGSYWPKNADINYYASKGMNVIRVPFLWQRIQPTLGASFATAYAASLDSVVAYATGKGVWVVLDVHK